MIFDALTYSTIAVVVAVAYVVVRLALSKKSS
jgi:hypothetical protein